MKKYADLLVKVKDIEEFKKMLELCKEFKIIALGFDENKNESLYSELCKKMEIEPIIRTKNINKKIKDKLSYIFFTSKKETINLIKRYKIDILTIDLKNLKTFDIETINFVSQRKTCIEILYTQFLKKEILFNEYILRKIKNLLEYCLRKKIKIIISSGAENYSQIRKIKEIIGFFQSIGLEKYNIEKLMNYDRIKDLFNI